MHVVSVLRDSSEVDANVGFKKKKKVTKYKQNHGEKRKLSKLRSRCQNKNTPSSLRKVTTDAKTLYSGVNQGKTENRCAQLQEMSGINEETVLKYVQGCPLVAW